jgi:hypothetical protein
MFLLIINELWAKKFTKSSQKFPNFFSFFAHFLLLPGVDGEDLVKIAKWKS